LDMVFPFGTSFTSNRLLRRAYQLNRANSLSLLCNDVEAVVMTAR
jgi:hypothetical protein